MKITVGFDGISSLRHLAEYIADNEIGRPDLCEELWEALEKCGKVVKTDE